MARSERVVDDRRHVEDSTKGPEALGAYTGARPEVQALVPRSARRVLDLGVRGRRPRREHGIFDRGHLRWFTLRDVRGLLEQAGLEVVEVRPLIRVRPRGPRFDRLFAWLGRTPLRELFAFQFVIGATTGPAPQERRGPADS